MKPSPTPTAHTAGGRRVRERGKMEWQQGWGVCTNSGRDSEKWDARSNGAMEKDEVIHKDTHTHSRRRPHPHPGSTETTLARSPRRSRAPSVLGRIFRSLSGSLPSPIGGGGNLQRFPPNQQLPTAHLTISFLIKTHLHKAGRGALRKLLVQSITQQDKRNMRQDSENLGPSFSTLVDFITPISAYLVPVVQAWVLLTIPLVFFILFLPIPHARLARLARQTVVPGVWMVEQGPIVVMLMMMMMMMIVVPVNAVQPVVRSHGVMTVAVGLRIARLVVMVMPAMQRGRAAFAQVVQAPGSTPLRRRS